MSPEARHDAEVREAARKTRKKADEPRPVTPRMLEDFGIALFGDRRYGPGAWPGQLAAVFGLSPRAMRDVLAGRAVFEKRARLRQYWLLRELLAL